MSESGSIEQSMTRSGVNRVIWMMVAVGVLLRIGRFALNYPLWGDEACLAANLIDRDFVNLFKPLNFGQICPPAFLVIELAISRWLGFHEWVLRLFPLLCAVTSVPLFRWTAAKVLKGVPLLLAVAIFSVSLHPLRHAAEVKPYASDLMAALVLLALALAWLDSRERPWPLWCLVIAAPLAVAISHPAIFVAGGVGIALLGPVWRTGRWSLRIPFGLFAVGALVMFAAMFVLSTGAQTEWMIRGLREYWKGSFPPLDDLPGLLRWLVSIHTGTLFAYPGGGQNGRSTATFLLVVLATIWLWRGGRKIVVTLVLAPFGLALIAAALRRYPYGVEARQMQFVAPAICLLAGLGAGLVVERIRRAKLRGHVVALAVMILMIDPILALARDTARPYRYNQDQEAREMARRFWPSMSSQAELACLRRDFGIAGRGGGSMKVAMYLCNQRMYATKWRAPGQLDWASVRDRHPLRVVLHDASLADGPAVPSWLASMKERVELVRTESFAPRPIGRNSYAPVWVVYDFVPRAGPIARSASVPDIRVR
ncbi:MAG: hypothetical protein ACHRXM_03910 [Isosphaerales bacterium]